LVVPSILILEEEPITAGVVITSSLGVRLMGKRSSGNTLLHLVQSTLIGLEEDVSFLLLRGMQYGME
jgi:hypothetical protein